MNKKQYSTPIMQIIPADADMICVSAAFGSETTPTMHAKKKQFTDTFDEDDLFFEDKEEGFVPSDSIL